MKVYVVFYNNPYGATGFIVFSSQEKAEKYIRDNVPGILKKYYQIKETEVK